MWLVVVHKKIQKEKHLEKLYYSQSMSGEGWRLPVACVPRQRKQFNDKNSQVQNWSLQKFNIGIASELCATYQYAHNQAPYI